ncbi:MAG: M15 family metallopeptidase [Clostridia bacterium]|nr:M15 family metallopeptidase [Clostridia bacterium]
MLFLKKNVRCFVALLAVLLCLGGCIHLGPKETTTDPITTQPPLEDVKAEHYYKDATYAYVTDVDEGVLMTGLSKTYLLLANKSCVLGADYEPQELVTLPAKWTTYSMKLEARAADALTEMLEEMAAAGIRDTYVTSAYRSYKRQQELFEGYREKEMQGFSTEAYDFLGYEYIYNQYLVNGKKGLNATDAERVVLSYSAAPGTSEHQTGLCVDFITAEMAGILDVRFEQSDVFAWLKENAYKFGFVLRYPKGKETTTGYSYEPWHYRFVGREAATDIYCANLTLEEYLGAVEQ